MTHIKKSRPPSPGRVEKEKLRIVLGMLPEDGSKRRWIDLEKQAREMKMSLRTLTKNLHKLEFAGIIIREVDTSKRPPGVYYRRHIPKKETLYVWGPEAGRVYDPEDYIKEISRLKKEDYEAAKKKLLELIIFHVNQALRSTIDLFFMHLKKQGDVESFNCWMDILVRSRLEMLLQLCISHFDVTMAVRRDVSHYYRKKIRVV
jgi:hypothetical protein